MSSLRRMQTGAALALLAMLSLVQSAGAVDQTAGNAALLDKYFAAVNAHDLPALKDVIAENYVQHDAGQGRGLAGMQAAFQRYFQTFPDFHMTLADSVITNDKIVARFQITATHDHPVQLGPNAPVFPPTGKKLSWQGISIWRVADGKFVEHWDVDDLVGLAQQMRGQPPGESKQP
jgi:predicted ester cyclase